MAPCASENVGEDVSCCFSSNCGMMMNSPEGEETMTMNDKRHITKLHTSEVNSRLKQELFSHFNDGHVMINWIK